MWIILLTLKRARVVLILSLVIQKNFRYLYRLFHEISADYIFFEQPSPSSPARMTELLSYYTHSDFLRLPLHVSAFKLRYQTHKQNRMIHLFHSPASNVPFSMRTWYEEVISLLQGNPLVPDFNGDEVVVGDLENNLKPHSLHTPTEYSHVCFQHLAFK